jgi:hypothetical protein
VHFSVVVLPEVHVRDAEQSILWVFSFNEQGNNSRAICCDSAGREWFRAAPTVLQLPVVGLRVRESPFFSTVGLRIIMWILRLMSLFLGVRGHNR